MNLNDWLQILFITLCIAGIFGSILLATFFLWSAIFLPVVKLRQHNLEKQKLETEMNKIIVDKEISQKVIDDNQNVLDSLYKQKSEVRVEIDKLEALREKIRKENKDLFDSFEAMKKKDSDKPKPGKTATVPVGK